MKASVLTHDGANPMLLPTDGKAAAWKVEPLDIVSEYSLKLTVWALQSILANSRCHASKATARSTLTLLADTGDVDVNERGLPSSVKFPGKPEDIPNVWVQ